MPIAEQKIASAFGLDDRGWARHASPSSGWSRIVTGMSPFTLAFWSRVRIGWWSRAAILTVRLDDEVKAAAPRLGYAS